MNLDEKKKQVHLYKDYYIELYKLLLNSSDEKLNKDIEQYVNGIAERYLEINTKNNFIKYLNNTDYLSSIKPIFFKYNLKEEIEKIKAGNKEELNRLIEYFKIRYSLKIKKENIDINSNELSKLKDYIEEVIRSYFKNNVSIDLSNYVYLKVIGKYCIFNNIRFSDAQLNRSIELRNNIEDKQHIYDEFSNRLIKCCPKYMVLSQEDIIKLIKKLVKNKVDSYDKFKKTGIDSYIATYMSRLREKLMDEEEILIEYNRNFSDKYNETIEFIYNKYKFLVEKVLRKIGDNSIKSVLNGQKILKELVKEELDHTIDKKYCEKIMCLEQKLEERIIESKKEKKEFNIDKARYGTLEEKEIEEEILYNELLYIRDKFLDKNYYTNDYDFINNKVMNLYKNYIHAYVFGNSTKHAASYVMTRLSSIMTAHKEKNKKKFDANETELLYAKKSMRIIKGYLNTHELSDDEYKYFIEYIRSAFKYYICNLCYKEDIESFMLKTVLSYNYNDTKNICKVLKHHK